jgi:hypothetical protein
MCGNLQGVLYANSCAVIAASSSSAGGYCSGDWTDNAGVDCDSNGNPTGVSTEYGKFGNCQQATGNTDCSIAPESYYSVDYCCQPQLMEE